MDRENLVDIVKKSLPATLEIVDCNRKSVYACLKGWAYILQSCSGHVECLYNPTFTIRPSLSKDGALKVYVSSDNMLYDINRSDKIAKKIVKKIKKKYS